MAERKRRYPLEEFARRGEEMYRRDVLPKLTPEDRGKFVAVDIESGDFEVDADERLAGDRLLLRQPDAQIWMVRAGYRVTHSIGRPLSGEETDDLRDGQRQV